ncbi:hypothetical protein B0T24DRAFT_667305 [Lasiosphaeria ovina]|uniref:Uncharacterized protein n=1 Tax=Lasiosphaeria ovina TaxID=92902 RepID=A0AAE0KDH9_9PEZI|nr:hypothetical protein B0T24DRAFT_667305 [Lasiosphaeria ovina]
MDGQNKIIVRKPGANPSSEEDGDPKVREVAQTRQWLQELLKSKRNGQRVMSPATERRAKELVALCDSKELNATTLEAVRFATEEMEKRLELDEKYAPALERIRQLEVDSFRLRYGDYLAAYMHHVRKNARILDRWDHDNFPVNTVQLVPPPVRTNPEAWQFFMSQRWTDIYVRLYKEETEWRTLDDPTDPNVCKAPLTQLLYIIASRTDQRAVDIYHTIGAYSRRNEVAHSAFGDYAKQHMVYEMKNELEKDLRNLAKAPKACQRDVPAIKKAILSTASKYFDPFVWDDETQMVTTAQQRPQSEISAPPEDTPHKKKKQERKAKKAREETARDESNTDGAGQGGGRDEEEEELMDFGDLFYEEVGEN